MRQSSSRKQFHDSRIVKQMYQFSFGRSACRIGDPGTLCRTTRLYSLVLRAPIQGRIGPLGQVSAAENENALSKTRNQLLHPMMISLRNFLIKYLLLTAMFRQYLFIYPLLLLQLVLAFIFLLLDNIYFIYPLLLLQL